MPQLWYVNSEFETELADGRIRRPPHPRVEAVNRQLSRHILKLAQPGDGLFVTFEPDDALHVESDRRGVEIVSAQSPPQSHRSFTPWGWTAHAVAVGESLGAIMRPLSPPTVAAVNSKLFSHALECEFGVNLPGAFVAASMPELTERVACEHPKENDKWVIKSHLGFAARERTLGRGPRLATATAVWCQKRFDAGESLLCEPWLEVVREYGVQMRIAADGACEIVGFSDQQTNGAGTIIGFRLGRPPTDERRRQLSRIAEMTAEKLFRHGYVGPVGVDALEHRGGLRPLLEINARHTVGLLAVAAERESPPSSLPRLWRLSDD
jgi:hypothetical protein